MPVFPIRPSAPIAKTRPAAKWTPPTALPEPHAVALRFCGKALMWRSAAIIAVRARIRNLADLDHAIAYARNQGWLGVDGDRNVCLTVKGMRVPPAGTTQGP